MPDQNVTSTEALPDGQAAQLSNGRVAVSLADIEHIGPGTLNGRYMRRFWHPVYHSADLKVGHAKPIRILAEDFVVYRGESGHAQVIGPRCPHRGMSMVPSWIEGDTIRCMYHGWRFDPNGRCVEQPAEKNSFCDKIKIPSYPTREYLGFVFAYLGEGEPPEFPRYPAFEAEGVTLHTDSYTRACGFFNNMENAGDLSHIAFAHRDAAVSWDETVDGPTLTPVESEWGVETRAVRPSGRRNIGQIGFPNAYHVRGVPDDPEVPYREFMGWWVPIDDNRHTQFTVVMKNKSAEHLERYHKRRLEALARQDLDREHIASEILAGRMRLEDVDKDRVHMIFLQDDIVQAGVGPISSRPKEHLGRGDAAVILYRRIWLRELEKFANNEPVKDWKYDPKNIRVHSDYR